MRLIRGASTKSPQSNGNESPHSPPRIPQSYQPASPPNGHEVESKRFPNDSAGLKGAAATSSDKQYDFPKSQYSSPQPYQRAHSASGTKLVRKRLSRVSLIQNPDGYVMTIYPNDPSLPSHLLYLEKDVTVGDVLSDLKASTDVYPQSVLETCRFVWGDNHTVEESILLSDLIQKKATISLRWLSGSEQAAILTT